MSSSQLKNFLEALKLDAALRQRIQEASDNADIVAIASDAGYAISMDDLTGAEAELSDEDLENAAGGSSFLWVRCDTGRRTCNDAGCKN